MAEDSETLASHVEETVDAIAEVHRDHRRQATALQRASDRLTAAIGRPGLILAFLAALAGWAGAHRAGHMYLQVEQDNVPALRLYERMGFGALCAYHYRAAV